MEPLHGATTLRQQKLRLLWFLDTFCNDDHSKRMTQLNC